MRDYLYMYIWHIYNTKREISNQHQNDRVKSKHNNEEKSIYDCPIRKLNILQIVRRCMVFVVIPFKSYLIF